MILIIKSDGTVLPAAQIRFGSGVGVEHRGNNVWKITGFVPASAAEVLTEWKSRTVSAVVGTRIQVFTISVTGIVSVTRHPWKTRTRELTVKVNAWAERSTTRSVTAHEIFSRLVSRTDELTTVRANYLTHWQTGTHSKPAGTQSREITQSATVTKHLTNVLTYASKDVSKTATRVMNWLTRTDEFTHAKSVTRLRSATHGITREITREVSYVHDCGNCDASYTVVFSGCAGVVYNTDTPCSPFNGTTTANRVVRYNPESCLWQDIRVVPEVPGSTSFGGPHLIDPGTWYINMNTYHSWGFVNSIPDRTGCPGGLTFSLNCTEGGSATFS